MQEKLVAIAARFPESEAAQINDWRRTQHKIPNMSEAMRELVLLGLETVINTTGKTEPDDKAAQAADTFGIG